MKIIVSGANGQLGTDIVNVFNENGNLVFALTHDIADISDKNAIEEIISQQKPDLFINTAAFHNVDKCEEDIETAMLINSKAAAQLSELSKKYNFQLIHISTDYVFDGAKGKPYIETDETSPLNNYGKSKLEGEKAVLEINPQNVVVRVSAIYGSNPCRAKGGLNFIQLMLKLASENKDIAVVDSEFVSPTNTKDIAKQLVKIAESNLSGIIHATSEGECSWYDLAEETFNYSNIEAKLKRAEPGQFPIKTPRPNYSVLENSVLKNAGINIMPHWKDALHQYLDEQNILVANQ